MRNAYVIGNLNVDVVIGTFERWPEIGSEVLGDFFDFRYAGAAGNSAMALKMLGFNTHVISAIGNDEMGKNFVAEYEKRGIDLSMCKRSQGRTCSSIGIATKNDERTFFTFLGNLNDLSNDFVFEKAKEVRDSWIILCGFNLISSFQESDFLDTIKSIKSNGNKILFDPGWPTNGWNAKEKESALNIAQLSDIFSPNLKETLAISRSASLDNALNYFKKYGVSSCVVKLGGKGAKGFIDGEKVFSRAFRFGEVKDTVGAGDMFNAALIKGLSENWEIEKSLGFATLYASLGITRIGKMRYPSFKEAYSIFKSKMGM